MFIPSIFACMKIIFFSEVHLCKRMLKFLFLYKIVCDKDYQVKVSGPQLDFRYESAQRYYSCNTYASISVQLLFIFVVSDILYSPVRALYVVLQIIIHKHVYYL